MNDVFLAGEKIDLCVPGEADFVTWANWFNDQEITQFLEQGKFPNTIAQQRQFYDDALKDNRFLCLIKTKSRKLLGVISLSGIDYEKAACQVAYVCPEKDDTARQAPLEALAICTTHAFERLGMKRVWAGHSYPGLRDWIRKTELLGYRTDCVRRNGFRHGINVTDAVQTTITMERYLALAKRRNGSLWPGEDQITRMLAEYKRHSSLVERAHESIVRLHREQDELIDQVELNVRQ